MIEITQKDEVVISEIIAGARNLFEKFGLKKTTMEDIAREVGKGKSSLYYYFQSKYEIFEAVIDQEARELFAQAERAIEEAGTAKGKLKAYSRIRLCNINKMGNLSQIVKDDLMDNISILFNIKRKHEITQLAMVRKIIAEGVASGEFKQVEASDIDLLAFLFMAAFRGIALPFCTDGSFPDLSQRVDTIVDVMVEGIGR